MNRKHVSIEESIRSNGARLILEAIYSFFFQVLCLSHFSTYRSTVHIGWIIHSIAVSTFDILTTAFTMLTIWSEDKNRFKKSILIYYVSCASIIAHAVVFSIAHIESFTIKKQEAELYRRLRDIEDIFALKLSYVRDFDAIRRKCVWPTIIYWIIAGLSAYFTSLFSIPSGHLSFFYVLFHPINVFVNRVRRCQISMHINHLTGILVDLKILLERERRNNYLESTEKSTEFLRHIRDIYSNVWLIVGLFDSCYGWSLVTCLMEFAIDFINSSYQIYLNFRIYKSTYIIFRNYLGFVKDKLEKHQLIKIGFNFRYPFVPNRSGLELLVFLHDFRKM